MARKLRRSLESKKTVFNSHKYFLNGRTLRAFLKLSMLPFVFALFALLFQIVHVNLDFNFGKTIGFDEFSKRHLEGYKTTGLLAGELIQGSFTASEHNLGLVLVRFFNFYDISSDQVQFRIKEKEATSWYYQASYKVDQFLPDEYFSFGFPEIKNTKGKSYIFEIQSTNGQIGDAIGLSKKEPAFAAGYKFYKQDLQQDTLLLFRFLTKKLFYGIRHTSYLFVLQIYFATLVLTLMFAFRRLLLSLVRIFVAAVLQDRKVRSTYREIQKAKNIRQFETVLVEQIHQLCLALGDIFAEHFKKTIQKINQVVTFLKKKLQFFNLRYGYFISILILFLIALLLRLERYYNPDNVGDLIFSGIGGAGDYDRTFRNAWSYLWYPNQLTYHLSFENDQVFLSRLYAFFFKIFGFLNGLHVSVLFFSVISALVCTVPYFVVTRLKRASYGAFLGSLLFAISPLSIWLASARIIDTFTLIFFSSFIILILLALERRKLSLLILLGLIGFVDGFNRGMMFFNDGPALGLFALLFVWQSSTLSRSFPFIKISLKALMFACIPFAVFALCYSLWYMYFTNTFGYPWFFGPKALATDFNPVSDQINVIGQQYAKQLLNLFLLGNLTLIGIATTITIPLAFTASLGVLLIKYIKGEYIFAVTAGILLYVALLVGLQQVLPIIAPADLISWTARPFLQLEASDYKMLVFLLGFFAVAMLFLRRTVMVLSATIVPYILVLAYGLYISFSERHFIQVLLVVFIIYAILFDMLLKRGKEKSHVIYKSLVVLYFIAMSVYIFTEIGKPLLRFDDHYKFYRSEKDYLTFAQDVLPQNAIVLVGAKRESPTRVANITRRTIAYNINAPSPATIPYKKGWFYLEYSSSRKGYPQLDWVTPGAPSLSVPNILADLSKFPMYNFYILDYDVKSWQRILSEEKSGHPFIQPNVFALEKVAQQVNGRSVYKLIVKH